MYLSPLQPSGCLPTIPTETQILQEIGMYQRKLEELEPGRENLRTVYKTLLQFRRKLLAATRDGKPDCWIDYPDS